MHINGHQNFDYKFSTSITFKNEEDVKAIFTSLKTDAELKSETVVRKLHIDNNTLHVI